MSSIDPSLSVLITYHNEGVLLSRCIESLLTQRRDHHPPMEVLVFDDASSVPPDPYIDEAVVRIVRSDHNVGPAAARNRLFYSSRGNFVHFHDSDDAFRDGWLDTLSDAIGDNRADWIVSRVASGENGVEVSDLRWLRSGDILGQCLLGGVLMPASTIRREVFASVNGFDESLWQSEDWDLHLRLALAGCCVRLVDEVLVLTFVQPTSRSLNQREVYRDAVRSLGRAADRLLKIDRAREASIVATKFGLILQRCGEIAYAREAFALAKLFGGARLEDTRFLAKLAFALLGPEHFERLCAIRRAWRQP